MWPAQLKSGQVAEFLMFYRHNITTEKEPFWLEQFKYGLSFLWNCFKSILLRNTIDKLVSDSLQRNTSIETIYILGKSMGMENSLIRSVFSELLYNKKCYSLNRFLLFVHIKKSWTSSIKASTTIQLIFLKIIGIEKKIHLSSIN